MGSIKKPAFYVGTSNITLPVANKRAFPEAYRDSSRLAYYASIFNSLEINSSFYKTPMAKTVAKWTLEVPEDFRFTYKMNRDITHDKTLTCDPQLIGHFMQTINNAGERKGSLLIQFPAGVQYNPVYLKRLLGLVQQHNEGWDVAVEFRHASWYRDSTYKLLENEGMAMVVHDMPRSATPPENVWSDFIYLRFHGPKGDYRGAYDINVLEDYAGKIKAWVKAKKTVYAYFNNTMGNAVFDALALQELVTGKVGYEL